MQRRNTKDKVNDYSGSSKHLKKDINLNKIINIRLKLFIALLVVVAGVLVWRLYTIQIIEADHYQTLYEQNQTPPIRRQTMRGEMYDRNMESLVTNTPKMSITYSPVGNLKEKEQLELAMKVSQHFDIKPNQEGSAKEKLSNDDLKVIWLRINDKEKRNLVSDEEYKQVSNNTSEYEKLLKSRITDEMLDEITEDQRAAYFVLFKMQNILLGAPAVIKEGVSIEEVTYLTEHLGEFPGFDYIVEYDREVTDEVDLQYLFGSVGDIRAEKLDYFLGMGYKTSDKVGSFGLEYQYESFLSGIDSKYEVNAGNKPNKIDSGQKGYDLKLSIDVELQKLVEETLISHIEKVRQNPKRYMSKEAHMVISDPNTGDILAIAAMKRKDDGTYYNDVQSVLLSTGVYPVGSVVKPATVYMSLDQGVIGEYDKILDEPMYIQSSPVRTSWRSGIGYVDARSALQYSSNIYMYQMAIKLGGAKYIPNGPLRFENADETFKLMRQYYSQFGLGNITGIDYPREEVGDKGPTNESGKLLDFAIGQFDSYNALELNQYVSTIANGGTRLKPRLVTEVLEHDTKNTYYENEITPINTLTNQHALKVIQEGMRIYITSGQGYGRPNAPFNPAGKSGTAQMYHTDYSKSEKGETLYARNSTYIAYAPFESPEIAVSCIAPAAMLDSEGQGVSNMCGNATADVMEHYFKDKY